MIPVKMVDGRYSFGVPRTRGDDPATDANAYFIVTCSPHTRG